MELALTRHPASPPGPIEGVRVDVQWSGLGRLALTYRVVGDIGSLVVPGIVPPERADDLWRTTCFEMFLKLPGGGGYAEYNFSPSTRWAAYVFDGYRAGQRNLESAAVQRSDIRAGGDVFELGVVFDPGEVGIAPGRELSAGLTAVLEMRDRTKSYWALAHPTDNDAPDFHRGDCFIARLRAPQDA